MLHGLLGQGGQALGIPLPLEVLAAAAAVVAGAAVLLLADTAARSVISPIVLPVGAVTSLLGAPLFFYLLLRGRKAR